MFAPVNAEEQIVLRKKSRKILNHLKVPKTNDHKLALTWSLVYDKEGYKKWEDWINSSGGDANAIMIDIIKKNAFGFLIENYALYFGRKFYARIL